MGPRLDGDGLILNVAGCLAALSQDERSGAHLARDTAFHFDMISRQAAVNFAAGANADCSALHVTFDLAVQLNIARYGKEAG